MLAKLFIAIPAYGGIQAQTMGTVLGIISTLYNQGVSCELVMHPDCALIAFARAELMGQFLHSDCTHMLFMDADISFDPNIIVRILKTNKDIVAGIYKSRHAPYNPTVNIDYKKSIEVTLEGERLCPIYSSGMGCVLLSKSALKKTCDYFPELKYVSERTNRNHYALFQETIKEVDGVPRYLSEDISFFHRLIQSGCSPVCLVDATIIHNGQELRFSNMVLKKDGN
jgi:hypothetical protein